MAFPRSITVLFIGTLICIGASGIPTRRFSNVKPVRQILEKAPYPPAGFRPRIPFELPNERKPKAGVVPVPVPIPGEALRPFSPEQPGFQPKPEQGFEPQPGTKFTPDFEPHPGVKPQPDQEFQPGSGPQPGSPSRPDLESPPSSNPQPEFEPTPEFETKPGTPSKPGNEFEPQSEEEPQPESEPQPELEPEPEFGPFPKPQPDLKPKLGFKPQPGTVPQPGLSPNPEIDSKFGPEPTTTPPSPIEDFDLVIPDKSTPSPAASTTENPQEFDIRTPADTYGAPDFSSSPQEGSAEELTAESISVPANNFQLPARNAAQEFSPLPPTIALASSHDAEPVADFPATNAVVPPKKSAQNEGAESKINLNQTPAGIYGPPDASGDGEEPEEPQQPDQRLTPDATYGPPLESSAELADEIDNDVEELTDDGQYQVISRLRDLKNGRLLFFPTDGTNLRQIYFAEVGVPRSRQSKNGRLIRTF